MQPLQPLQLLGLDGESRHVAPEQIRRRYLSAESERPHYFKKQLASFFLSESKARTLVKAGVVQGREVSRPCLPNAGVIREYDVNLIQRPN
jgi:hypothetical protein